jgi:hypothetical protein
MKLAAHDMVRIPMFSYGIIVSQTIPAKLFVANGA